jgi:hypothetical protein
MKQPSTATIVSIPAIAALVALVMVFTSYRAAHPASPAPAPAPATVRESALPIPGPEQATLEPLIMARECEGDGDAVCVVTFRVAVGWKGAPLPAGQRWELSYRVSGLLAGGTAEGRLTLKDGRVSGVEQVVVVARDAVIGLTPVRLARL